MRIGYAQLNTTVGDIEGNFALGIDAYEQLCGQGVDLIIFPELFLCGYPPRDLLHKENFLPDVDQALLQFAKQVGPTPALMGYAEIDQSLRPFEKLTMLPHGAKAVKFLKSSGSVSCQPMMSLMKTATLVPVKYH